MSRGATVAAVILALVVITVGCSRGTSKVSRIVFITVDTTRADRIGCYGYELAETPAMDGLAAPIMSTMHLLTIETMRSGVV